MSTDDALGTDDQLDADLDSTDAGTDSSAGAGDKPDSGTTAVAEPATDSKASQDGQAGADDSDTPSLFDVLDRHGLEHFRHKYRTADDAWQGLIECAKVVGQRDNDAATLKQLREKYGEDRLTALLDGKQTTEPDAVDLASAVPSAEDFDLLMEAAAQPNASEQIKRRAQKARGAMIEAIRAFAKQGKTPKSPPPELAKLEERFEALEKRLEESQRTTRADQFLDKYASKLYVDGVRSRDSAKLTPFGQRFASAYHTDEVCLGFPEGDPRRLEAARRVAEAGEPRPQPTRSATSGSRHQPPVAPPVFDEKILKDIMQKHGDDDDVLDRLNRAVLESKGA